ncbi:MAG: PH domain-containing protein [Phycisphaerales bacterium]|nr:MAG: PH domain-containing protein [Phycisphaerales bacterium]
MIPITCDNCERPFEARDEDAGGKVACPYCGDVNRVPAAPPGAAAAKEEHALPPDGGPEQRIQIVRPAMFRAHPLRAVIIALLILGGIVLAVWLGTLDKPQWVTESRTWLVYGALALGLIGLLWLAKWWVRAHMWVKLEISNKRIIRHEGIITRKTSEVLHDHVRNVEIRQTFFQRLFGVGYIGIASAGQEGIEIQVHDIPGPDKVKALIDRYREM